jgi:hypothetical protein
MYVLTFDWSSRSNYLWHEPTFVYIINIIFFDSVRHVGHFFIISKYLHLYTAFVSPDQSNNKQKPTEGYTQTVSIKQL